MKTLLGECKANSSRACLKVSRATIRRPICYAEAILLFTTLDPGMITTPKLFKEVERRFRAMAPVIEFLNAPLAARARKVPPGEIT